MSSPRHQLLTDSGHNDPHTCSDAETRSVHCKVDPPRMSTRHPDLKEFQQCRKADARQKNERGAGPVPDREQKPRESERRHVLQIGRHRGFRANTGGAEGQTDERHATARTKRGRRACSPRRDPRRTFWRRSSACDPPRAYRCYFSSALLPYQPVQLTIDILLGSPSLESIYSTLDVL